jgi:UDP-glucose 4-epimerase
MKVFITGAGLIGSHTAALLADQGHEVVVYDAAPHEGYLRSVLGDRKMTIEKGDVGNLPAMVELMLAQGTECVIHTVGLIGPVAQRRPYGSFAVNVAGTVNVAEAARLAGASRLVYTSTHGVYDVTRCRDEPMTEASPTSARSIYAGSKLAAEALLEAYGRAYALDMIVIRFCNVYGRGLYVAGSRGGEAFNELVEKPVRGEAATALPPVRGRGEWVYAKDAARALKAAIEREASDGFLLVNIGTGVLTTFEDIAAAVRRVIPDARFETPDAREPEGTPRSPERSQPFDLRRAREALDYEPAYDLQTAVEDYVAEIRRAAL